MVKAGVAEMPILRDDHVTVTDLPQRTQAEMCDFSLGDCKAECTSVRRRDGVSLCIKQTQTVIYHNVLKFSEIADIFVTAVILLTYCCFVRPRMTSRFSKALRDGMSFGHC